MSHSSVGTVLVIAEVRLIIGLLNNRACVCVYMCATAGKVMLLSLGFVADWQAHLLEQICNLLS